MDEEGSYICPSCGEEIVVPLDISAGEQQEYVEDLPGLLLSQFDPGRIRSLRERGSPGSRRK